MPVLEAALMALQRRHSLLRSNLSRQEQRCHFRPINQPVPLAVLPMPNDRRAGRETGRHGGIAATLGHGRDEGSPACCDRPMMD
jgi:hypothetical protein